MQALRNARPQYSWANLPSGIDKELFIGYVKQFSYKEKICIAAVCKTWRTIMEKDEMGENHILDLGLQPIRGYSWMRVCGAYLRATPYILAVDVSGSMLDVPKNGNGFSNIDLAIKKVCKIASECGPAMAMYGVDCIAFDHFAYTQKAFSVEEVCSFFTKKRVGGGTNLEVLFKTIFTIQNKHLECNRRHAAEVHIISDFDASYRLDDLLIEHKNHNANFRCHRLLREEKCQNAENFQEALKNHFANNGEEPKVQTRSEKRKREEEKKLDCSVTIVNPKELGRKSKKQKTEPKQ